MTRRAAAVAGSFYPGNSALLREQLEGLLLQAQPGPGQAPEALVVPHAGYVFSGSTAATAYRLLQQAAEPPSRVVLLGPAHRVYLQGLAVPSVDYFSTPLGEVPLDRASIEMALALPGVCTSDAAHELEHSLEVQLPFLQCVLPEFTLVPVVVGDSSPDEVAAVLDALWGGPETLVIISTDLSHFQDYDAAELHDQATCERILRGDTSLRGTDACGAAPLNGLLHSMHGGRLQRKLIGRCNSGDTGGDRQRVVGYGAFALY
jgi:MEMO1 family protein